MVGLLFVGYLYALIPQVDTLAASPHLIALAYLLIHWGFGHRWTMWVRRAFTFAAMGLCLYFTRASFGIFNGLDPGTTLLSAAILMKFSELRTFRDFFIILLINLFLINSNLLYSIGYFETVHAVIGNLALYYLMVVCSSTVPLGPTIKSRHSLRSLAAIGKLPAMVRQNLAALLDSGQTGYARTVTAWAMVVALPLAALIFFAYPRLQVNLFNLQKSTTRALTGFTPYMEPGRFTELFENNELAFRANFTDAPPEPENLYWRALTLERFAGGRWTTIRTISDMRADAVGELPEEGEELPAGLYEYELILPDHQSNWLFSLDHPVELLSSTVPTFLDSKGQLSTQRAPDQITSYKLRSRLGPLMATDPDAIARNLILPPGGKRARALAAQWSGSPQDKLTQAIDWLRAQNFAYSMSVSSMRVNSVDRFLFEEKRGYCEHFSSSFAFLMRAAGVPARVVIGYQGGLASQAGNTVQVYQYSAHAWVEVLLPDRADGARRWRRVDPTALAEPRRLVLSGRDIINGQTTEDVGIFTGDAAAWFRWTKDLMLEIGFAWDSWVLSYGGFQQRQLLDWLRANDRLWLNLLYIISATALLVFALYRFSQWRLARPRDKLAALLQDFRRVARSRGIATKPSQGCHSLSRVFERHLARPNPSQATETARQIIIRELRIFAALWQGVRYQCRVGDPSKPLAKEDYRRMRQILLRLRRFPG